ILARRTDALRTGEEAGWLADVDPGNAALIGHERQVFANLRQFDLDRPALRAVPGTAPPARTIRYANSLPMRSWAHDVELRLRLRDVDTAENAARYRYVFGLVDGVVKLVDVGPAAVDGAGVDTDYLLDYPWDLTALRVRRQGDVVVAADAGVKDLDDWRDAAGRASRTVRRDWADNPAPKALVVFLASRPELFRGWFGPNPTWAEGALRPVRRPGDGRPAPDDHFVGARVVVNLAADHLGTPYETMKHQLAQALSVAVVAPRPDRTGPVEAPRDGLGAANWAVQGFARYVQTREAPALRDRLRTTIRDGLNRNLFTGDLPDNAAFWAEPARAFNPALGYSVFQYVAARYGHAKALALYVAVLRQPGPDGSTGGNADLFPALAAVGLLEKSSGDPRDSAFYQQWTRSLRQL
ncbi:hypothetical protein ACFQ0D_30030, partial [Micromonospora zhanjiangensis]